MANCETLPLCPDTTLNHEHRTSLSEPVEVGPFTQGIVFIQIIDIEGDPKPSFEVGISPSGYDNWDMHWTPLKTLDDIDTVGMYALPLENFGNWIRVRSRLRSASNGELTYLAWFVGTG